MTVTVVKEMRNRLNPARELRYVIVAELDGQTHVAEEAIAGGDQAAARTKCMEELTATDAVMQGG